MNIERCKKHLQMYQNKIQSYNLCGDEKKVWKPKHQRSNYKQLHVLHEAPQAATMSHYINHLFKFNTSTITSMTKLTIFS